MPHWFTALPTRGMVELLYLKQALRENDEDVVQRCGETPTWPYFSGQEYFKHRWPCDCTLWVRCRKLLTKKERSCIIVDSNLQEKAIAHPIRIKRLHIAKSNWLRWPRPAGQHNAHA